MISKEFVELKIMGTEAIIEYYQTCHNTTSAGIYRGNPEYIDMLIHYFQQEKRQYQQVLEDLNDKANL